MNLKRVFISGRVSGAPAKSSSSAAGVGELLVVSVEEGGASHLWSVFLLSNDAASGKLNDGDVVAVVGLMNEDRQKSEGLRGPIMVEAILALKRDGEYIGAFTGLG